MKRIVLFSLFSIYHFAYAQNPLVKQWDYRFGGSSYEEIWSIRQTTDGGYVLGGFSRSDSSGDKTSPNWDTSGYSNDYWIVKTDSLGIRQWDKVIGGTVDDRLFSLQQTADGGYISGGYSYSQIGGDKTQASWAGGTDYWIVKTDSLGNKQWDKDFGGTGVDFLLCLQQTTDGGFILGGYSGSVISGDKTQNTAGGYDYWIVKTDSLGIKQWDKDFGGTGEDRLFSIHQTTDGGYIFGGWSDSGISGNKTQASWGEHDYWIVKTDSLGIKQWDKDFGGTFDDKLYSLQQTSDGGYILGGFSYSGISGDKTQPSWGNGDYWMVKTDALGNKQWDKDIGGISNEDEFGTISQTADSGYLIAGTSYSPIGGDKTEMNLGAEQTWVIKTNSLGIKQWDKTLHTDATFHDETGFAIQTKDGCYLMANSTDAGTGGDKTQASRGYSDYWIIKFCDTTSATGIQPAIHPDTSGQSAISIYPNPAVELLVIRYPLSVNQKTEITICDSFAKTVFHSTFNIQHSTLNIDISKLSPGIYFIRIITRDRTAVKKFVKE